MITKAANKIKKEYHFFNTEHQK